MHSQISIGTDIRSCTEQLRKVPLKYISDAIRNPKPDIANKIRQLRIVRQLNPAKYAELKRALPYFVCAAFAPPFRKNGNFAHTECFVIDIDHITEKGLSVTEVKERLKADSRTLLLFESPGGDGLKLMMHLKERCYDPGLYSIFYKDFVLKFSEQHGLLQVVDAKTSDVARACFISTDPDVYFNPDADAVDLASYIDVCNPQELFDTKKLDEKAIADNAAATAEDTPPAPTDPDKETIDRIKHTLELGRKRNAERETMVHVPEILNDIIGGLKNHIEETGVEVTEISNIQYGKKLKLKLGAKHAEINLFYGKRGFSVVQTPRTGTNAELNDLMAEMTEYYVKQL